ncbi:MAG: sugar transferase [Chloroflexota bacterium]
MTWLVVERPGVKLYKPHYQNFRRVIDVITSLIFSLLLTPLFFIIALAVKIDSKGPILFVQERVGKGGRRFKMYKFRTMHINIDRHSHQAFMKAFINGKVVTNGEKTVFKPFESTQVTRMGRLLRKTSLDELPQLINILKGEMSLIGPRPNVPWEVEEYRTIHQERLEVLPGITGLAQVRGRSGITFDEIVRYDIEYVEKQSIALDMKILWWTFISVVYGKGAE